MSDLRNLFKPEMFIYAAIAEPNREKQISDRSQEILNEALSESKPVYAYKNDPWWKPFGFDNQTPERSALLVCIEEIKPCEHEPCQRVTAQLSGSQYEEFYSHYSICRKCGGKLKAKWEAE